MNTMSISHLTLLSCLFMLALAHPLAAEQKGATAVFVINDAEEFAAMGGECVVLTQDAVPAQHKRLLAFGKGPTGSVLVMVAFEPGKDELHRNLPPVIVENTGSEKSPRFPADEDKAIWPFTSEDEKADLFILLVHPDDPMKSSLLKNVTSLQSALKSGQSDAILLQSLSLRTRIGTLMRNRNSDAVEARIASSAIAAVRRGFTPGTTTPGATKGARSFKSLEREWTEDSQPVPFAVGSPGLLLFKIGKRD